jgi:hypothetical protein
VSADNPRFTIRVSASRLNKGLIAIPRQFKDLFPADKTRIQVAFDDEAKVRALTFHPYDALVKETRIFGLGNWFKSRGVREGDLISVVLENREQWLYRINLDRYLEERQQTKARQQLQTAQSDLEAEQQLNTLSRLTKKRPREVAHQELLRIAQQSRRESRPSILPATSERHEGVPSGVRILLRELHDGKCQLCSFTFEKRNGEPFFEIHHLDPKIGHHPTNLLVVCPNCHAQFEHAIVTDLRLVGPWLVGVRINGKRFSVRQPLAHESIGRSLLGLIILVAATRVGQMFLHRTNLYY